MTDSVELKGVLEAALSEDGGIILIRNAMAEYQSHKKVHAAVISEVHPCDEHGNFMIDITNPLYDGITIPYMVTPDMVARFTLALVTTSCCMITTMCHSARRVCLRADTS